MPSETPLDWIGSAKKDFLAFPEPVIDRMGYALGVARLRLAREDYSARTEAR